MNHPQMPKLVPLDRIQEEFPGWPYGSWPTGRLIRLGELGCVRVGKRIFVTREIIDEFIARHTEPGRAALERVVTPLVEVDPVVE